MSTAGNETDRRELEDREEAENISEELETSETGLNSGMDVLVYIAGNEGWIDPYKSEINSEKVPDPLLSEAEQYDDLYVFAVVPWGKDIRKETDGGYEVLGRVKPYMADNPGDIESLPSVEEAYILEEIPMSDGGTGKNDSIFQSQWGDVDEDTPYDQLPYTTGSLPDQK